MTDRKLKGRKLSAERIEKLKGRELSEETKRKMSESHKKRKNNCLKVYE